EAVAGELTAGLVTLDGVEDAAPADVAAHAVLARGHHRACAHALVRARGGGGVEPLVGGAVTVVIDAVALLGRVLGRAAVRVARARRGHAVRPALDDADAARPGALARVADRQHAQARALVRGAVAVVVEPVAARLGA